MYGSSTQSYATPTSRIDIKKVAEPVNSLNNRLTSIMKQIIEHHDLDDKPAILERIKILREEIISIRPTK